MTLRCALYARYSSDQQRAASIEDQFRICRERAEREGWKIAGAYKDSAVSGSSVILRPGVQALLKNAGLGEFDVVLAEALDRVSRDQADVAVLYKHLRFAGVGIFTLAEGEINELHVGLKGTMNALFLKDLAAKTRRGQRGRVEAGKAGGSLGYGYDVVKALDATGEPIRGERRINEQQAGIVRRIFREFANGASPRAIARRLNDDGVPGPRGKRWSDNTLRGHAARGTGLLNNELYVGRLVWNRQRRALNPETGRKVSRINPSEEWVVAEVPHLRILDDDLWQAAKDRQDESAKVHAAVIAGVRRARANPLNAAHRPRHLLSGLLECGVCGGAYAMRGQDRYACSNHARTDGCTNRRSIRRAVLEERVLAGLKHRLMAPEAAAEAIRAYAEETNRLNRERRASGAGDRRELAAIEKKIATMIAAIEDGGYVRGMSDRLRELEARQDELAERLAVAPADLPDIHPNVAEIYRRKVARLADALKHPENRDEAATATRGLIERIVLMPGEKWGEVHATLHGDLGTILEWTAEGDGKNPGGTSPPGLSVSAETRTRFGVDFAQSRSGGAGGFGALFRCRAGCSAIRDRRRRSCQAQPRPGRPAARPRPERRSAGTGRRRKARRPSTRRASPSSRRWAAPGARPRPGSGCRSPSSGKGSASPRSRTPGRGARRAGGCSSAAPSSGSPRRAPRWRSISAGRCWVRTRRLKRFSVLVCHRRFGKTVLCVNELIDHAVRSARQRPRYAYIAPLYRQAKQVAWDYLKHYTAAIPGRKVNETELRVDLPNGARIQLYGADNPDSLRGIYLDGAVLDEYAQMSPHLWGEVIRPALADREGWAIFIGTPKGHNEFWRKYRAAVDDESWYAALFAASDTGVLPAAELEAARRDMTEEEYAQEFECSFEAAIRGAYYGRAMAEAQRTGRIRAVPHDPALPVDTAWDLGVGDPTAIWFVQLAGPEIHLLDYYEAAGEGLDHYARVLQAKAAGRGWVYGMVGEGRPSTSFVGGGERRVRNEKQNVDGRPSPTMTGEGEDNHEYRDRKRRTRRDRPPLARRAGAGGAGGARLDAARGEGRGALPRREARRRKAALQHPLGQHRDPQARHLFADPGARRPAALARRRPGRARGGLGAGARALLPGRRRRVRRGDGGGARRHAAARPRRRPDRRIKNAEKTMMNNLSEGVYSDGTGSSGKQIGGLRALVADDPTTGTVGGIDRAAFEFWRNQVHDFSEAGIDPGADTIQKAMNALWLKCLRGADAPTLIVADTAYFNHYWQSLQAIQRISSEEDAGAGFRSIQFYGPGGTAPVMYDDNCPEEHMYMLNTDYLFWRPHKDANMEPLEKRQSTNQDATVIPIVFMGNLTMSNAARQGVIHA